MSIELRPAQASDKARWFELWQGYLDFYKTVLSPAQSELTWSRIMDPEFNMKCAVAMLDGSVVGFTTYNLQNSTWSENGHCYLEDLFVDPAVRGGGVGRALIKAVEEIAIAKGSKRLYWTTAPDNETARKLYDKVAITDRVQYKIFLNQ